TRPSCWPARSGSGGSSSSGRHARSSPTRASSGPRSTSPAGSAEHARAGCQHAPGLATRHERAEREDTMAVTARAAFDRQLHTLQDDTLLLGSMVEKAIERAVDALV